MDRVAFPRDLILIKRTIAPFQENTLHQFMHFVRAYLLQSVYKIL